MSTTLRQRKPAAKPVGEKQSAKRKADPAAPAAADVDVAGALDGADTVERQSSRIDEEQRCEAPKGRRQPHSGAPPTRLFGLVPFPRILRFLVMAAIWCYALHWAAQLAYKSRLYALKEFGMVIHEFDPWFNFRATQYFSKHGWTKFFHWYDYMVWYPLGRPVGSTIYPGLQITSVAIHRTLRWLGKAYALSLNDVCCLVPAWFGAVATVLVGLMTYETSGSGTAGSIAAAVMSVLPAHMMRSVGGGFDNESIAMSAMVLTFYLWIASQRTSGSWPLGALAGLAYGYMVAAWGGFIYVTNMVAIHAFFLVLFDWIRGRYSTRLYRAYTLYFIIGTFIATRVPVVGMTPFSSLEQVASFGLFLAMQVLHLSERERLRKKVSIWSVSGMAIRAKYLAGFLSAIGLVVAVLWPMGYFGPLGARIRGLFVKHTLTGNPLVDSVAEHQPASPDAYWEYLHYASKLAPYGVAWVVLNVPKWRQGSFLLLNAAVAMFFSLKMARLLLITAPIASALTGVLLGCPVDYVLSQCWWPVGEESLEDNEGPAPQNALARAQAAVTRTARRAAHMWNSKPARLLRIIIGVAVIAYVGYFMPGNHKKVKEFYSHADRMAHSFSHPQIMFKADVGGKRGVIIDDYRDAYHYLRDKTPLDSRVMAWWDYGYQITGIGNRTSIADGNTWNHEHIATLGRCLTSPMKRGHAMIRHLADYVLVWSGDGGDLGKSPHMARIGNSIYRDICGTTDPLCRKFGFYEDQKPTPMMRDSVLYNLHRGGMLHGVNPDPKLFQHEFTSKYGLVRIWKVMNVSQESKKWVADPANRLCDAPGSWYCKGQYPPAPEVQKVLKTRRDFAQLEDFNNKKGVDRTYGEEYMKAFGHH